MVDRGPPPKRGKPSTKRFQQQWYDDNPSWKKWLKNIPNQPNKFRCLYCQNEMSGGLSEIKKHEKTLKHADYAVTVRRQRKLRRPETRGERSEKSRVIISKDAGSSSGHDYILNTSGDTEEGLDFNRRVKKAEIIIATMAASLDMPFSIMKDVVKTFQFIGKDPDVLESVSLSQTKVAAIIKNVISPRETCKVQDVIKKNKFSVYVETSDNINEKWMSIMVRYVHPTTLLIHAEFLELIPLDFNECPAWKLFKSFKISLDDKGIPFDNIVSVACDNAPIMTGNESSFKTLVLNANDQIRVFPCVGHSLALLAHDSAQCAIPVDIDCVMSTIATYINSNPKRSASFKEFQFAFNEQPLRLLRHSDTRWLSRFRCMDRILKEWDSLISYLKKKSVNKSKSFGALLSNLENDSVKAYLYFLHFVLNQFNQWNEALQTRDTYIQNLQPLCRDILLWIVSKFLTKSFLESNFDMIRKVNLSNPANYIPLHEIDIGSKCEEFLRETTTLDNAALDLIRQNCLKFYVYIAEEIIKKLPFDDALLSNLTVFKFEDALNNENRDTTFVKVAHVANELKFTGNIKQLRDEWNELFDMDSNLKTEYAQLSFDELWTKIGLSTGNGRVKFPNLRSLLNTVRCIPHSNAEAELAFSIITEVKNKKRTRLSNETLNSLCLIKWNLKVNNINAIDYKVTKGHLLLMNSDNLYKKKKPSSSATPEPDD